MTTQRTRVLVVDDAKVARELLSSVLGADPSLEVVGAACDAYEAREMIKQRHPDVITLDIEMPGMDGLTFLRNLMRLHPLPVVMVSSLTNARAATTLEALELGAVDFVAKAGSGTGDFAIHAQEIVAKVKAAARVSPLSLAYRAAIGRESERIHLGRAQLDLRYRNSGCVDNSLIMIGASTGGTEAIRSILELLPAKFPPAMIVQHIPSGFAESFAERLNSCSRLDVRVAERGTRVQPGRVFVAPGDQHLLVRQSSLGLTCDLDDGPPVNNHRPSIEVLFDSARTLDGVNIVAAILTGMGADGATALRRLRDCGARTFAQDQESCVVWGMPRAAIELGAVECELPIGEMADALARTVLTPSTQLGGPGA